MGRWHRPRRGSVLPGVQPNCAITKVRPEGRLHPAVAPAIATSSVIDYPRAGCGWPTGSCSRRSHAWRHVPVARRRSWPRAPPRDLRLQAGTLRQRSVLTARFGRVRRRLSMSWLPEQSRRHDRREVLIRHRDHRKSQGIRSTEIQDLLGACRLGAMCMHRHASFRITSCRPVARSLRSPTQRRCQWHVTAHRFERRSLQRTHSHI